MMNVIEEICQIRRNYLEWYQNRHNWYVLQLKIP